MMNTWRLDLDGDAQAPRFARNSARSWLDVIPCQDDTKVDIIIVVSEFVTEAVNAGAAHVSIGLLFDDGRLRVEVQARQADTRKAVGVEQAETMSDRLLADHIANTATDIWRRTTALGHVDLWAEVLC